MTNINSYHLLFPDGEYQIIQRDYCENPFHTGETIFWEGSAARWRISDVKHQLRETAVGALHIMTILLLEEIND